MLFTSWEVRIVKHCAENEPKLPEPEWVAIARNTTKATKTTQIMSRWIPSHLKVAKIDNQV